MYIHIYIYIHIHIHDISIMNSRGAVRGGCSGWGQCYIINQYITSYKPLHPVSTAPPFDESRVEGSSPANPPQRISSTIIMMIISIIIIITIIIIIITIIIIIIMMMNLEYTTYVHTPPPVNVYSVCLK